MTCNHCNGEHPDDFKFCPVTGREMVQALLACTNEGCLDFGKAVLPVEAKFCPRCGQMLAVENLSQESGVTVFRVNGVEFEMIHVEGGSFDMGSDDGDAYEDEMPVHRVALSSYRMGKYPVTQELWKAVMGNNPSYFEGPHRPVENVSWNDCQGDISIMVVMIKMRWHGMMTIIMAGLMMSANCFLTNLDYMI